MLAQLGLTPELARVMKLARAGLPPSVGPSCAGSVLGVSRHLRSDPDDASRSQATTSMDSDKKCRIKPPGHWLGIVTEHGAFEGKKFVREIAWAEDCVDRAVRSGQGTDPEVLGFGGLAPKTHHGQGIA